MVEEHAILSIQDSASHLHLVGILSGVTNEVKDNYMFVYLLGLFKEFLWKARCSCF